MRRRLWLPAIVAFIFGLILGQNLPNTLIDHPIATLKAMKSLPVGSHVALVESTQFPGQFSKGFWGEYGIVTGYEAVRGLNNETVLLYRVRTQEGSGPLLTINPQWITRINPKNSS